MAHKSIIGSQHGPRGVPGLDRKMMRGSTKGEAVKLISREPAIVTNFDLKEQFCGGTTSYSSKETKLKVRNDFVDSMFGSDHILCIKGNGNYSVRSYETTCSGRIPIFLDTDCVLPFDEEINWKEYCVWIERKDLHSIGQKVVEFHESLSPPDFIKMQKSCRKLWEERLSPEGSFSNLYRCYSVLFPISWSKEKPCLGSLVQ